MPPKKSKVTKRKSAQFVPQTGETSMNKENESKKSQSEKKSVGKNVKSSGLKQETLGSYSAFRSRIKEIEEAIAKERPKPNIYIVFSGSYSPGPKGRSWCGMCTIIDDYIQQEIVPNHTDKGYLLFVRVGDQEEWADPNNPFRKDPKLKLKSIPAAVVWGTERKLEGFLMISSLLINELFGIGEVDPEEATKQKSVLEELTAWKV